jgi:hypothetical protein
MAETNGAVPRRPMGSEWLGTERSSILNHN